MQALGESFKVVILFGKGELQTGARVDRSCRLLLAGLGWSPGKYDRLNFLVAWC